MSREQFNSGVHRPSDLAAESNQVGSEGPQSVTLLDGNSGDVLTYTNNSGSKQQIQFVSVDAETGEDANARADLQVKDGSGTLVHEVISSVRSYPFDLQPTVPLNDGWSVNIRVHNNNGVETQYISTILYQK